MAYAWDPVGFINRRKDPNDPEEALEGYITGEIDLIKFCKWITVLNHPCHNDYRLCGYDDGAD
ncbi:MAG: hypothetical protein QNK40_09350 [Desulfobacterales bacterium]|nr:hypothetical protein [Desulfobacterales bacterium]